MVVYCNLDLPLLNMPVLFLQFRNLVLQVGVLCGQDVQKFIDGFVVSSKCFLETGDVFQ